MPTASRVAADLLRVLPRKQLSSLMGRLADLTTPPALVQHAIRTFVRVYGVELDEAVVPSEGFDSFDAFFTRALKGGARAVDPRPDVVVSPADGRIEDLGVIEPHASFRVKGFDYEVGELLGAAEEAQLFQGGTSSSCTSRRATTTACTHRSTAGRRARTSTARCTGQPHAARLRAQAVRPQRAGW